MYLKCQSHVLELPQDSDNRKDEMSIQYYPAMFNTEAVAQNMEMPVVLRVMRLDSTLHDPTMFKIESLDTARQRYRWLELNITNQGMRIVENRLFK